MVRTMMAGAIAAIALALAAGCGGDDAPAAATEPAAAPVAAAVSEAGYALPQSIAGGVVAMTFRNAGADLHEFALGRVGAGHTAQEAIDLLTESGPEASPPWLRDVAGPGLLTPGAQITVTRVLPPGDYVFFDAVPDTEGVPGYARGLVAGVTVAGDSGAQLPRADAVVTAGPDGIAVPPLAAGTRTIELRNASGTEREFMLGTLEAGATDADVERWGRSIETTGRLPAEPFPGILLGAIQSIPDGTSVFLTLDLDAGREYRISDAESGHATLFTPR